MPKTRRDPGRELLDVLATLSEAVTRDAGKLERVVKRIQRTHRPEQRRLQATAQAGLQDCLRVLLQSAIRMRQQTNRIRRLVPTDSQTR